MTSRVCLVNDCESQSICRGMCKSHYMRWRRHGDPLAGRVNEGEPMQFLRSLLTGERGDECVTNWPFAKQEFRGKVYWRGKVRLAHRVICEMAHGAPPFPKAQAAHSCGNGHLGCLNPHHLRWATSKENAADKLKHGTDNRGSKNHRAKLDERSVLEIRKMLREGLSFATVAKQYGIVRQAVGHIKAGTTWGHLDG